jgi:hypothetical protein
MMFDKLMAILRKGSRIKKSTTITFGPTGAVAKVLFAVRPNGLNWGRNLRVLTCARANENALLTTVLLSGW